MKVFKFGGASVNSADAVRNMAQIVQSEVGERRSDFQQPLVVVVSAMGKTTNLLEKLVPGASGGADAVALRRQLEDYHRQIARDLMPENDAVQGRLEGMLASLDALCATLAPSAECYNRNYDQVVSYGELLSTTIIAAYLEARGLATLWADARQLIITDAHHRDAHIDWSATQHAVRRLLGSVDGHRVVLTQGFIGGTADAAPLTSTLGREGSDYSAAILAHCLDAESVTIWKDVPGFLNADPKYFRDTVKISQIPYNEAIELAYYGASVIHPKTVKPLQNKGIPLYIRSFVTPDAAGSAIGDYATICPETPLYIFRNDQILLSIFPRDYSFIAEDNLQVIFGILNELGIRVNLMQNTALSFSICVDNQPQLVGQLIERLQHLFRVRYNEGLQLVTIRYYTQEIIDRIVAGRPVLLEQRSRTTEQLIVHPHPLS